MFPRSTGQSRQMQCQISSARLAGAGQTALDVLQAPGPQAEQLSE